MEDREDIRFMPFHQELLPAFGSMTGVFVVRDQAISTAAREAYPDAHVLVIDPERIKEDLPEYNPGVIASWPLLKRPKAAPHTEIAVAA